jgi:hypothetical protein
MVYLSRMRQRVFFDAGGDRVLDDLYLPAAPGPHPAVAVAGPMTAVKEQVTGVHPCALASRGFAALALDHRPFGESGGVPRRYEAAMTLADTHDDYATSRAAVPNHRNQFAVMSREHFVPFDVQAAAPRLRAPLAMVHSENALSPAWARAFFDAATCTKSFEWVDSKGQVDFYDEPRLVRAACDRIARHLHVHLGGGADS